MNLSLFYFAANASRPTSDPYRLLLEGARFADRNGFSAVWTPERHFAQFGGLYPNPSVTGAAVAAITSRIQIRAGSVVVPLHHPLRLAEEWSVLDNLSGGRIGLSLAPGWNPTDFVLQPDAFERRRELTEDSVEWLRTIWRGEPVACPSASGLELMVYPRPVSNPLPLWLTTSGAPAIFTLAGRARTGVLTHLMNQSLDELAEKISLYREALRDSGSRDSGSQWRGHVTLMLHTYVSNSGDAADVARPALTRYLTAALQAFSADAEILHERADRKLRLAVSAARERYLSLDGLIGNVDEAVRLVRKFEQAGVDEIACLVDFGIDTATALRGLGPLAQVLKQSPGS
ncbi:MupA/Atu3671 family FMN-dependent luciferase-like monooxygenase [Pseudonocardia broussonetiae]|uniref:LLM class flavin-dependent oxidoreductase n=1 Tax=Pseudonocardia broussonetiae TaxID=2736640 RepID=A0A6M6JH76_9PSEU|nr:MupA/Atu3671 family FMN-dependent luciferase-like monooxygenase [Pseudonocardia broussonetiae]QJY45729.1 LLM class flavin-dependent oxidoreductase [Pseudonocardia broussonetiae]